MIRPQIAIPFPFIGTLVAAAVCNAFLKLSEPGGVLVDEPEPIAELSLFVLSTTLAWPFVAIAVALAGRFWTGVGVATIFFALLAFVNRLKLEFRFEPLYPSDFHFVGDLGYLGGFLGWSIVLRAICLVTVIAAVCTLASRLASSGKSATPANGRRAFLTRAAVVACSIGAIACMSFFNAPGNYLRHLYETHGAQWQGWSQKKNYAYNGFIPAFLYNLDSTTMRPPSDYSKVKMREIALRYHASAERLNQHRDPEALSNTNIVLVLSESFTDPTRIPEVAFDEDPIPFTRNILKSVPSGPVLTQSYGGGTANMEFSVLTGQSVGTFSPQTNTPYQQVVPRQPDYPSAVRFMESAGFDTVALHPFDPRFYMRREVYERFGFDHFLGREEMALDRPLVSGHFASDDSAFREVDRVLEEANGPLFAQLVTMQNHMPYDDRYANPIMVDGPLEEGEARSIGQYARGLKYTDEALRSWLERLEQSDERTVVLFYGDHQPGVWSTASRARVGDEALRRSVFFVWKNFGEQQPSALPTTSPIHFLNHVFDAVQAPIPPYFALLRALEREIPAMEGPHLLGSDGRPITRGDLSPAASRALHDYELVQYDFSVGERYALSDMFYPAPAIQAHAID